MPDMIFLILLILLGSYALFTGFLTYFWFRIKSISPAEMQVSTRISVIIPVRNEATTIGHLLNDLHQQSYPLSFFEVLLVDDSSTDATVSIAQTFLTKKDFSLKIIQLAAADRVVSPKKRAIETALATATGTLIVTTDGDCRVGPDWLLSLAQTYEQTKARLISGPVTFVSEKSLGSRLQTVEFSSLIGSGASSIQTGMPTMCNGANLAYEKRAFQEVGGFQGNEKIASGDDEFLLHKINRAYPGSVFFLKDRRAIVQTTPPPTWKAFYHQRKRWASKWKYYQNPPSIVLALFIFAANAALLVTLVLGWSGQISLKMLWILLLLKWLPEWLFIGSVLSFLRKKNCLFYIPLVQLIYPFYVTLFGLVSQKPTYRWKDRTLQ